MIGINEEMFGFYMLDKIFVRCKVWVIVFNLFVGMCMGGLYMCFEFGVVGESFGVLWVKVDYV